MKRRLHPAALGAALALLLSFVFAADGLAFSESAIPIGKGLAADCTTGAELAPGSADEIDWAVWCGPTPGRFTLELGHPKGSVTPIWEGRVKVAGPGAVGMPACAKSGDKEVCRVRKSGPVTLRGSFRVPGGACVRAIDIWLKTGGGHEGEGFGKKAWGCPGSNAPHALSVGRIVSFYVQEDIGPALHGGRAAVVAKAKQMRRAWIREAPVERWSADAWGAPVGRAEAEELALRLRMTQQAGGAIPRWVHENQLGSIYAGWFWGREGDIFVGFTKEPDAMVARLKADVPFIAPGRVKPFARPPLYNESQLEDWMERVVEGIEGFGEKPYGITHIDVDVLANAVEVGAEHVAATKRLMAELFGPEAPIEVVKGFPAILA
jgi:hypothetical protein